MNKVIVAALLMITLPTVAQAPAFPWPSVHVHSAARNWHAQNPDESFAVITQSLADMSTSGSAPVRAAAVLMRDRFAVAAGLIDQGGNVDSVQVYKEDFDRIMAIVRGRATPESAAAIRAGFQQVLQTEFVPIP